MSILSRIGELVGNESAVDVDFDDDGREDLPAELAAADRVAERTRQEFLEAIEDEELAGREAYAAMEALADWFSQNSSAALMAAAGTDEDGGERR